MTNTHVDLMVLFICVYIINLMFYLPSIFCLIDLFSVYIDVNWFANCLLYMVCTYVYKLEEKTHWLRDKSSESSYT